MTQSDVRKIMECRICVCVCPLCYIRWHETGCPIQQSTPFWCFPSVATVTTMWVCSTERMTILRSHGSRTIIIVNCYYRFVPWQALNAWAESPQRGESWNRLSIVQFDELNNNNRFQSNLVWCVKASTAEWRWRVLHFHSKRPMKMTVLTYMFWPKLPHRIIQIEMHNIYGWHKSTSFPFSSLYQRKSFSILFSP